MSCAYCCSGSPGEDAAMMTPQEMGQVNKELSHLQPVIDTLTILTEQRHEVRHAKITACTGCIPAVTHSHSCSRSKTTI